VVKEFLMVLGVDEATAGEDACKIEHGITPETLRVFTRFVKCIHKNEKMPVWLEEFRKGCKKVK
jgi:DtxR family Mn-dependent transcriptional regulator